VADALPPGELPPASYRAKPNQFTPISPFTLLSFPVFTPQVTTVELYLGASDENISESYQQTCLPAFTGHLAEELRSLASLTSLQLRYRHATRASDIRALGTLTGLTGLTALTIHSMTRPAAVCYAGEPTREKSFSLVPSAASIALSRSASARAVLASPRACALLTLSRCSCTCSTHGPSPPAVSSDAHLFNAWLLPSRCEL
jgi:hypothetical protein